MSQPMIYTAISSAVLEERQNLTMNRCFCKKSNTSTRHLRGIPGLGVNQKSHVGLAFKIKSLLFPHMDRS